MSYAEWEAKQNISPIGPEAYYAERAWNAGLRAARDILSTNESVRGVLDSLITDHEENGK